MSVPELRFGEHAGLAEAEFYAGYTWCLNPVPSVRTLFQRLREELDRWEGFPAGWQREECELNLYLFVCAIACAVDDYLAWRPYDLSPISDRFPRLRLTVKLVQSILNAPRVIRSAFDDRAVLAWRRSWDRCVDL